MRFMATYSVAVAGLLGLLCSLATAVDKNNFKTCEQSSFCRRCRRKAPDKGRFVRTEHSLVTYSNAITFDLQNQDTGHLYTFELSGIQDKRYRIKINEKNPLKPRYIVEHVLIEDPFEPASFTANSDAEGKLTLQCGEDKIVITSDPFRVDFYESSVLVLTLNGRNLMNFEHLRRRPQSPNDNGGGEEGIGEGVAEEVGKDEQETHIAENQLEKTDDSEASDPGAWEENFKSHHDTKPNGPEAVAMDFTFPAAEVLFGIPEHADSFVLKSTAAGDPYRLYNLDVFEYEIESKMALYGSVPVIYGHGPKRTVGVFWNNAAETWVDIHTTERNVVTSIVNFVSGSHKSDAPSAHFMSESGIVDLFVLMGPRPLDTFRQYTKLTGTAPLPQLFSLAYHQCRWNYNDMKDVETVAEKFDEYDIPMDTMWLDIEYTDGKKYYTWDHFKFPDPIAMIKNLTKFGRHLVVIIDPHIKRETGYIIHDECTERGYYVKTSDGKDYEGWCWPGAASYPDFFREDIREYFTSRYLLENFKEVTSDVMIWNDMNEPSVFNGPEVTMPKDLIHHGNWEHRDVHNLYAHMHIMSTFNGLRKRDPNQRPFILTRGHFAGSQRYAAIWTGDNLAAWDHLEHSIKMCLSEAVAGFSFCGADVGGFFGNPDAELFERWYQTGAFLPFFRSHAHIDTKRREPWLYPEKTRLVIREAIRKRYSYLPLWYTSFYEHELNGYPVIRPMLAHYTSDQNTYRIENQFLVQDRLLVRPVMQAGVNKVDVYLPFTDVSQPIGDLWYDVDTLDCLQHPGRHTVAVDEYKIPVYQRGGTIVPMKMRIRRAATLMKNDPYTLVVALDRNGYAEGTLYLDDEKSYGYRRGEYVYVRYRFEGDQLINTFIQPPNFKTKVWLEKIIVAGLKRTPSSARIVVDDVSHNLDVLKHAQGFAIRKPGVSILKDFAITLLY